MMFRATKITGVPQGMNYAQFRLWLLQQIGVVSAGHWSIEQPSTLIFVHDADPEHLLAHLNRQLANYRIMNTLHGTERLEGSPA